MATSEAEPGAIYWALVAPYWLRLNQSWDGGPEAFLAKSAEVPPAVLDLYAGHWCQSEVNNGGLHQFFYNTTGILAPEAGKAFERVGLPVWSQVISEAMAYFGDPFPRDRDERLRILSSVSKETVRSGIRLSNSTIGSMVVRMLDEIVGKKRLMRMRVAPPNNEPMTEVMLNVDETNVDPVEWRGPQQVNSP